MDVEQLSLAVRAEHPQAIALIFLQLPPDLTARALAALPPDLRADVAGRMATTRQVDPAVSRALLDQLKQRFGHLLPDDHPDKRAAPAGGAQHLAEMLRHLEPSAGKAIVDGIAARDAAVAERVRGGVFTFADVGTLPDRDVQRLWRDLDYKTVVLALRGETGATRDALLRNVSQRVHDQLRRDVELLGPQRASAVREAQDHVAATARRLADTGEISIARGPLEEVR
ncbi:MAG TPA: FliG C-terminal domain-containing protein [Chloroflexota bacterium]|nr:FliG C-terminal domain-containing protein [Chloroflexota bacterium]